VNDPLTTHFATRGDLAHLALFLWATSASALLYLALKGLAAAHRRIDDFVAEIRRLTHRIEDSER